MNNLERDRARESAATWANAPVNRLLAAYDARRQPHAIVRDLQIEHVAHGTLWRVSWRAYSKGDWHPASVHGPSRDGVCTIVAEMFERPW